MTAAVRLPNFCGQQYVSCCHIGVCGSAGEAGDGHVSEGHPSCGLPTYPCHAAQVSHTQHTICNMQSRSIRRIESRLKAGACIAAAPHSTSAAVVNRHVHTSDDSDYTAQQFLKTVLFHIHSQSVLVLTLADAG